MKEWLLKMAKILGLPEGSTDEVILAKLSEHIQSGTAAKDELASIAAQSAAFGLKVEAGKLAKVDAAPSNPADLARIAKLEFDNAVSKLSAAKIEVDGLVKSGKVPPAASAALGRLFSCVGKMESVNLSKDGKTGEEVLIKGSVDILKELREVFAAMPAVTGSHLSRVGGGAADDEQKKESEKLSKKGKSVAARVQGKKPEPAGQK